MSFSVCLQSPDHQMSVCLDVAWKEIELKRIEKKSVTGLKRKKTSVQSVTFFLSFSVHPSFLAFSFRREFSSCFTAWQCIWSPHYSGGVTGLKTTLCFISREWNFGADKFFTNKLPYLFYYILTRDCCRNMLYFQSDIYLFYHYFCT